jgi:uncharacterized membrane protein YcaP (DUF421 family)
MAEARMTAEIESGLRWALGLGLDDKDIGVAQMGLRAAVVYLATVLMVRIGKKRFMGRATAFDVILGIMLGSIVSRAITGNAPFAGALAAALVLVLMHSVFSWTAVRWHGFGTLIKGRSRTLIRDGDIDAPALRKAHMTDKDLWEDLRGEGVSRLEEVAEARLERSGKFSVVKAERKPKILEIRVANGVQTVRLELA